MVVHSERLLRTCNKFSLKNKHMRGSKAGTIGKVLGGVFVLPPESIWKPRPGSWNKPAIPALRRWEQGSWGLGARQPSLISELGQWETPSQREEKNQGKWLLREEWHPKLSSGLHTNVHVCMHSHVHKHVSAHTQTYIKHRSNKVPLKRYSLLHGSTF